MAKPILKWAGGKRNIMSVLVDRISPKATKNNTFYDVFGGGASVSIEMSKYFNKVILNDISEEIISTYEVIRDNPKQLIAQLKIAEKLNSKDFYYKIRKWDRSSLIDQKSKIEKAMRTIYMNRVCFNGLYRVNSKGQFNVPYGRYKNPKICDEENIIELSNLFRTKISISNHDFWVATHDVKAGDVVYFDPPYGIEKASSFIGYNQNQFNHFEQERLKLFMDDLTSKKVFCIQSNSATESIERYYKNYISELSYIPVHRSVGAKGSTRGKTFELLFDNFEVINDASFSK